MKKGKVNNVTVNKGRKIGKKKNEERMKEERRWSWKYQTLDNNCNIMELMM